MTYIVWWESCITEHQIYTLAELSKRTDVNVTVFSTSLENAARKKQGWNECDWSLIQMKLISSSAISFIVSALKEKKNAVHIFGGPFDSWTITLALFLSIALGKRTYVLTEPYSTTTNGLLINRSGIKNWMLHKFRPLKFWLLWTLLRTKVEGVFAISTTAIDQLLSFGVRKEKILPFAYFVPSTNVVQNSVASKSENDSTVDDLRLLFVGTLNHTKGIDLAVNAVNNLRNEHIPITLDVFGPFENLDDYDWTPHVRYQGVIPSGEVQSTMVGYDFLILPSRYDGWGVVVNEALLAGIPVICSDRVGASTLILKWGCGACYRGATEMALQECLLDIHYNKTIKKSSFKNGIAQVQKVITPEYGAQYIYNCVQVRQHNGTDSPNNWYS